MVKIGRNDLCPCGSGKKYKKCCIDKDVLTIMKNSNQSIFSHLLTYEEIDAMSTDEIIDRLSKMGIPFDQATFLKDVETYYSAEQLSESWFNKYPVKAVGREEDFPWFAAWVLWERLAPANILSMEQMNSLLEKGYDYLNEDDPISACNVWLEFWEALKYRINPNLKSLDYLDREYMGTFFISNICQDLEAELYNAGVRDASYFEKRIRYCREFCNYFPEESELIIHNMKRAIGESYAKLNKYREAELEFKKLVDEYPDNFWGYIGWGDIFADKKDNKRARELYEKGLAIAKDESDIEVLKDRLEYLE